MILVASDGCYQRIVVVPSNHDMSVSMSNAASSSGPSRYGILGMQTFATLIPSQPVHPTGHKDNWILSPSHAFCYGWFQWSESIGWYLAAKLRIRGWRNLCDMWGLVAMLIPCMHENTYSGVGLLNSTLDMAVWDAMPMNLWQQFALVTHGCSKSAQWVFDTYLKRLFARHSSMTFNYWGNESMRSSCCRQFTWLRVET